MKKYISICIFFLLNNYSISQNLIGQIVELENGNSISYASLGILHKNEGTVTNSNGDFSLDISNYSDSETLRISALGFESLDFLIQHCKEFLINQESLKIELSQKSKNLDEVIVTAGKRKLMVSGNNVKSSMIIAGFQNKKLGAEMGTVLKYNKKRKGHIVSLNFNLAYNLDDSIKFRVNLYEMKNGLPDKNVLAESIYFHDKPINSKITIDVSELNINMKDDCFLSIELIENADFEGLFFKSAFLKSQSFHRPAPDGEWIKANVDLGFWAEIIYRK